MRTLPVDEAHVARCVQIYEEMHRRDAARQA